MRIIVIWIVNHCIYNLLSSVKMYKTICTQEKCVNIAFFYFPAGACSFLNRTRFLNCLNITRQWCKKDQRTWERRIKMPIGTNSWAYDIQGQRYLLFKAKVFNDKAHGEVSQISWPALSIKWKLTLRIELVDLSKYLGYLLMLVFQTRIIQISW